MSLFASVNRRRALTAGVTLLVAFATGHVMQAMVATDETATLGKSPEAAPAIRPTSKPLPLPPAATLTPISLQPGLLPGRIGNDPVSAPELPDDAALSPFGLPCEPVLELGPAPGAMIDLRLSAPCNVDSDVTLDHAGLRIEARTDAFGVLRVELPALDENASVTARLRDGLSLTSGISIPDAADFARVALIWEGHQVLSMHALELGAKYGDAGHVWSGAPKSPDRAARGSGGFLTRFPGRRTSAEIYSFPVGHSPASGVVRLTVAAEITPRTCDQSITARALQTGPLGGVVTRDVKVAMPTCDAVGETLRLKNLFQDMRLAQR